MEPDLTRGVCPLLSRGRHQWEEDLHRRRHLLEIVGNATGSQSTHFRCKSCHSCRAHHDHSRRLTVLSQGGKMVCAFVSGHVHEGYDTIPVNQFSALPEFWKHLLSWCAGQVCIFSIIIIY